MKKIISLIICFVMCLSFAACGKNNYIGIDKAKQTVVDDIGAALTDVEFSVNDLVTDNNGDYYRLHFTKDGTDYVYKVDAMTGKIIDKSSNSNGADDNSNATANNDTTDNLLDNNDNTDNNANGNGANSDNGNNNANGNGANSDNGNNNENSNASSSANNIID